MTLTQLFQFILSISILVILHELGHFLPARWFKTRIEKFFLFFDPYFSLFSMKKINGKWQYKFFSKNQPTEEEVVINGKKVPQPIDTSKLPDTDWRKYEGVKYGIGWLPLGGYVKIAGMVDESMDTAQLSKPAEPWEFRAKPAWQRLIIMLGGVTVNFFVGFLIFIGLRYHLGVDKINAEDLKGKTYLTKKMEVYGFKTTDVIASINGKAIEAPEDAMSMIMFRKPQNITVLREDGSVKNISVPDSLGMYLFKSGIAQRMYSIKNPSTVIDSISPKSPAEKAGLRVRDKIISIDGKNINCWDEIADNIISADSDLSIVIARNGNLITKKVILGDSRTLGIMNSGIWIKKNFPKVTHTDLSFAGSIQRGIVDGYYKVADYFAQFKYIFTKSGATQVGGFATMTKIFSKTWDWIAFWERTAIISFMLAVMNLLPIPALDGGHIVFLMYEIVTRKKPNQKILEYAQMIGFFILIGLMLYANGLDVLRAIKN